MHPLDASHLLMDHLSFKEVMVMRCVNKDLKTLLIELLSNGPISTQSKFESILIACLCGQYRALARLVTHALGL